MSEFVIEEGEIFKYLVVNEDDDSYKRSSEYIRRFLGHVSINIFQDEYYIFYEILKELHKLKVGLTYDYLQILLANEIEQFAESPEVTLFKDEKLSEREYQEKLIDYVLASFESLSEVEIEDENSYMANVKFYLMQWRKNKMLELNTNMGRILTEGYQHGKRFLRGDTHAHQYYMEGYKVIQMVVDGNEELLSVDINTAEDSPEEIREKLIDETSTEIMTITAVRELDEHYDYHKGEIVIVQAGTGVGKTRFTMNMVYNSLKMGKNVLYISLEQKTQRIYPMLQARYILENYDDYSDLTDKGIIQGTYDFSRQVMVDGSVDGMVLDENWGRLYLTGRKLKTTELYDFLLEVWDVKNFHFDVVVVDYIGLLATEKDRYRELTDVANMFKAEVKNFKGEGFLAILPNQLTKEDEKELYKGNTDTTKLGGSETQYIVRASDYVYTLFQDEEMRAVGKIRIYIGKVRLGEIVDGQVDVLTDLGKIHFMDNTKYVDDQVA